MWLKVNGETRQNGSTSTMIFGVAKLVADVSRYMTLEPGDVITTGTPPGVGMGMKPTPQYLKAGDVVELGIEGLGTQTQKVVAFKMRREPGVRTVGAKRSAGAAPVSSGCQAGAWRGRVGARRPELRDNERRARAYRHALAIALVREPAPNEQDHHGEQHDDAAPPATS